MYQVILDYEETSEEENRARIAELFPEFNTVPGVFYVVDGEDGSYLDTYHLGVGETALTIGFRKMKSKQSKQKIYEGNYD